jgi:ribonuclease HII
MPPGLPCPAEAVVKGDQRSQSIAAASIIAKVTRDRMMAQAGRVHTKFGFGVHMGYATARHRAEIADHGPLPRLHRATFAPFRLTTVEVTVEEELVLTQE